MSAFPGYFDYNATTPMTIAAREIWLETAAKRWHNPSGLYREAGEARGLLEHWREELADSFAIADPERIVFTSGATEANNAVIRYFSESIRGDIAVSSLEHPCVEAPVESFFSETRVRRIPVDPQTGGVDLEVLGKWISSGEVGAVSVMAANNETGALQSWREIGELCRGAGTRFHTDAAQWIGKNPVEGLGDCDFVTGSGHKFGGGKGTGFLILPEGEISPSFHGLIGGPQEEGRRAGTENLPGIVAMVTALLEREARELLETAERQSGFREQFEARISGHCGCRILAAGGPRLWNTSMFVVPHSKNLKWLTRLGQLGFSVSTGSACSSGKGSPSSVMTAMGLDYEEMGRVIRVSGGWETGEEDWQGLSDALVVVESDLRGSRSGQ